MHRRTEAHVIAHVEELLDAAPIAGVDLAELAALGHWLTRRERRLRGLPRSPRRSALERLALADTDKLCLAYKVPLRQDSCRLC